MVLELTKKDYNNLRTDYSNLNIVNRTQGSEFLIDSASVVNFNIVPNSIIDGDGIVVPEMKTDTDYRSFSNWYSYFIWFTKKYMGCRAEMMSIFGSFTAYIDEVIYNKDNISIDYEIDYDSYQSTNDILTVNNWYVKEAVYSSIMTTDNLINKDESNNRIPQIITNSFFDKPDAKMQFVPLFGINQTTKYASLDLIYYMKITDLVVDNVTGRTTITVDYFLPFYYGWNDYYEDLSNRITNNYVNMINQIKFSVKANTVNTTENTFDYGDFNEEPYALESNEFLQYNNGDSIENKMSYQISQEVFEKNSRNRMIVIFDLYRLELIDWDGDGNKRYICSRDRIKIKDEQDNYLGQYYDDNGDLVVPEFEIIKANGKWDGKFYKEIVAKQIMEDS